MIAERDSNLRDAQRRTAVRFPEEIGRLHKGFIRKISKQRFAGKRIAGSFILVWGLTRDD